MRSRFTVLRVLVAAAVGAVGAKVLVSCVDLESLQDGRPDAAAPTSTVGDVVTSPTPSDPCVRALLPAAPTAEDPDGGSVALPSFVLAIDQVSLDPGKVRAFDLDGICTCDGRPGAAFDGGPGCAAVGPVTCDLDGGGDNALGLVAAAASPLFAIDGVSNRLIAAGQRTLLIQLSKYNGQANDREVVVGTIVAEGIRTQGCPTSTFDSRTQRWSKGGCGDDPWTLSPASVVSTSGNTPVPLVIGTGYVHDYELVVRFGETTTLPINDESSLRIEAPMLMGKIVPLDEQLVPRDLARPPTAKEQRLFRIEGGVISGRVQPQELLAALGSYRQPSGPLCAALAFDSARNIICRSADMSRSGKVDPNERCDAISAALGFIAMPAVRAGVADASVVATSCAVVDAAVFVCP